MCMFSINYQKLIIIIFDIIFAYSRKIFTHWGYLFESLKCLSITSTVFIFTEVRHIKGYLTKDNDTHNITSQHLFENRKNKDPNTKKLSVFFFNISTAIFVKLYNKLLHIQLVNKI